MDIGDSRWLTFVQTRFPGRMRRDEWTVHACPYCGNDRDNFQINVETMVFNCWVCGTGGTLWEFFKDFGLPLEMVPRRAVRRELPAESKRLVLPAEAKPIRPESGVGWGIAMDYLLGRGLTEEEIEKYQILFCMSGKYGQRVIWPVYEQGELTYFVARRFTDAPIRAYDYPEFRRRNLMPLYFGMTKRTSLVLVEGVFQIPSLSRLGYSVMALLGTRLTPEQLRRLTAKNFAEYIVLLDHDALRKAYHVADWMKTERLPVRVADTGGPDSDDVPAEVLQDVLNKARAPSLEAELFSTERTSL